MGTTFFMAATCVIKLCDEISCRHCGNRYIFLFLYIFIINLNNMSPASVMAINSCLSVTEGVVLLDRNTYCVYGNTRFVT